MRQWSVELDDEQATEKLAAKLARAPIKGCYLALSGPLGAGKTTLVRAMLRAMGVQGLVRSPTYTLMEAYETGHGPVVHLDLYRLADPDELEYLGVRECFDDRGICLVEWPERGESWLPTPDIAITIDFLNTGRQLTFRAATSAGERILARLSQSD